MTTRLLSVPELRALLAAAMLENPIYSDTAKTKTSLRRRGLIDERGRITPAGSVALKTKRIAA